jgi:hypothetical protein
MKEHLKECPECRRTLVEYREFTALMAARVATLSCPTAPLAGGKAPFALRLLTGRRVRRYSKMAAMIAACVMFFAAGNFIGTTNTRRTIAESLSPVAVATPSMWVAKQQPGGSRLRDSKEAEQPFTDSISQYRTAIGSELRQNDVDWLRVRELIEAMGELRTDLELLTIHMAYLDIRTGNSPYEVADHWENLSGKAVYK